MRKLGARLQAVADLVRGDIIADIGSDHAYLPAWLAQNNRIKKAYAIDVSAKCVERMKANLARLNIGRDIVEPVLCDGLPELEGLTDIIIAGMGGESIAGILSGIVARGVPQLENINFILQPNSKKDALLAYMAANGFKLLQELRVDEKRRYYYILRVGYAYIF